MVWSCYWLTSELAKRTESMKKLVPKGTSSYQATWIVDSDGEGEDVDDSDSEGEPDEEDDSEDESMGQEDMVS